MQLFRKSSQKSKRTVFFFKSLHNPGVITFYWTSISIYKWSKEWFIFSCFIVAASWTILLSRVHLDTSVCIFCSDARAVWARGRRPSHWRQKVDPVMPSGVLHRSVQEQYAEQKYRERAVSRSIVHPRQHHRRRLGMWHAWVKVAVPRHVLSTVYRRERAPQFLFRSFKWRRWRNGFKYDERRAGGRGQRGRGQWRGEGGYHYTCCWWAVPERILEKSQR